MMWRLYAGIALSVALAAGGWYLHHKGYESGVAVGAKQVSALKLSQAQALSKAQAKAQAKQQALTQKIAAIDAKHEQELRDAKQDAAHVIAALRAGNLRLRKQWRCETAGVPKSAAGAAKPDAAADDRAASASRIVRAAAEADAKIRALQNIIRSERKP